MLHVITFQFPLHREALYNGDVLRPHLRLCHFQFPLHREALYNLEGAAGNQKSPTFQFPLHREALYNPEYFSGGFVSHCLSVPSSSGSTIQPRQEESPWRAMNGFQFPLHREALYNFTRNMRRFPCPTFSSLFIGKHYTTQFHNSDPLRVINFQFPLHREALYNRSVQMRHMRRIFLSVPSSSGSTIQQRERPSGVKYPISFSSLFIGKHYTTWLRSSRNGSSMSFSSLFIGKHYTTRRSRRHGLNALQLSVPSSSGSTIQLSVVIPLTNYLSSFSSLFIGKHYTTVPSGQLLPSLSRLSVPSSSGSTIQHIH